MENLSELEIRAMFIEVEREDFSCDEILEMYGIDKDSLKIYSYFIERSREEFNEYLKSKKSLSKKPKYRFGSANEIRFVTKVRENTEKSIENYPQVREELIMGALEEDIQKIRYVGYKGFVNKMVDKMFLKNLKN